jgi:hypothetical protein
MRRRDIEVGEAYAVRPRTNDRLPARIVITAIETRAVQWVDSDTGRAGRSLLRDLLGP